MRYDVTFLASELVRVAQLAERHTVVVRLDNDRYNAEFMGLVNEVRGMTDTERLRLLVEGAACRSSTGMSILVKADD